MEEKKFYVPSIEEFHIGFEYELQNIENAQWGTVKQIHGFGCFDDDFNDLEEGIIRVKYLDKSDIEDLGFKFLKDYSDELVFQSEIKEDKAGSYWYEINMDKLEHIIEIEYCHDLDEYTSIKTLFKGTAKNKSELKKLLKMLNIG